MLETWLACDLSEGVQVVALSGNLFSQDKMANKIGVVVTDHGTPVTLSGVAMGSIIRADETSVTCEGSISGNRAWIVLPESAYTVVGAIQITIRIVDDGELTTIGACTSYVHRSLTDRIIDEEALYNLAVVPDFPTTDGTYTLILTISNGVPTFRWG